ncbi:cysteine hydrolase family protein [Pseudomonas syringae pv. actinidiae]|uniref:Cysteine hydrolase n=4 Tax=Pseudomonas syringae group TaxID=136849 RepID=A0A0K8M519_PSESF|nr:cysteine hydrolase family protein [Pseudomonas syringae]EPN61371.1 isochorismatase family protein [Pseudomonas syringae pv. actinidiae ICMP 19079]EPN77835.1 isochorismatase family protein [Pseudomonas syringae pv. actinidiae ICMP 19101]OZI86065.1 cysteine hydrolase [Pseudomonas avellanae]AKT29928.1 isochorismatase [Pseudomonas syringae pv. actinidiae ICMP 18884]AOE56378.1 isochorismatase [Pseudomonas syringae pv. actinidiae ICMP 18708]
MSDLKTMFQLSGRVHAPANLSNATLIIIDAQKEYLSGPLALTGVDEALANIGQLVAKARAVKCPIVHVRHLGTVGGLFDPQGERGQLVPELLPQGDEHLVEKRLPNAFNGTGLHELLQSLGHLDLVVCGFMSHSSISTTVRATKDYGYRCTLVDDACATRDLPSPHGVVSAQVVHRTEMAIMADNFATLALTKDLV